MHHRVASPQNVAAPNEPSLASSTANTQKIYANAVNTIVEPPLLWYNTKHAKSSRYKKTDTKASG